MEVFFSSFVLCFFFFTRINPATTLEAMYALPKIEQKTPNVGAAAVSPTARRCHVRLVLWCRACIHVSCIHVSVSFVCVCIRVPVAGNTGCACATGLPIFLFIPLPCVHCALAVYKTRTKVPRFVVVRIPFFFYKQHTVHGTISVFFLPVPNSTDGRVDVFSSGK